MRGRAIRNGSEHLTLSRILKSRYGFRMAHVASSPIIGISRQWNVSDEGVLRAG
jgi:hypothetical protein